MKKIYIVLTLLVFVVVLSACSTSAKTINPRLKPTVSTHKIATSTPPKVLVVDKQANTSTVDSSSLNSVIPAVNSAKSVKSVVSTKTTTKAPVKKSTKTTTKTTKTSSSKTTTGSVKWAASGLKAIGSLASFDYSTTIRNAYMQKIATYAKRKGITLITAAVVNSAHQ